MLRLRELRAELLAYYPGPASARSRLTLMDVNPRTLHAYWSVDPDLLASTRRRHHSPSAPLVLRLYEMGGPRTSPLGERPAEDTALEGLTNNRYLEVRAEGATYLGQIGLRTRRRFIPLITSGPVRLPGPPAEGPVAAPSGPGQPAEAIRAETASIVRERYEELVGSAAAGARAARAFRAEPAEAARLRPQAPQAGRAQGRGARPTREPRTRSARQAPSSLDLHLGPRPRR